MAGIKSLEVGSWRFGNKRTPPNISHEKIRQDIFAAARRGHVHEIGTSTGTRKKRWAKRFARTMGRRMKCGR